MSTNDIMSDDQEVLNTLLNDDDNIINNDIIITINTNKYVCYACLEMKDNMVKPCDTKSCKARLCSECIKKQVDTNNDKCGICRNPIVIKRGEFNRTKFCKKLAKISYFWFLIVFGSAFTFLMALGNILQNPLVRCISFVECNNKSMCDYNMKRPCDDGSMVTLISTIPFILLFSQGHFINCCCNDPKFWKYNIFCCGNLREKLRFKSYLTMTIMFFVSNGLIVVAHLIGKPLIKDKFNIDNTFTWRTSLAGFVVYAIIIAIIIVLYLIYKIGTVIFELYKSIIEYIEHKFSDNEYGLVINEDEDDNY